jgi:hypothetical protein
MSGFLDRLFPQLTRSPHQPGSALQPVVDEAAGRLRAALESLREALETC